MRTRRGRGFDVGRYRWQALFRLMHPLFTEQACLRCHTTEGYRVGDVHGGISISVPMEPFRDVMLQHVAGNAVGLVCDGC